MSDLIGSLDDPRMFTCYECGLALEDCTCACEAPMWDEPCCKECPKCKREAS